MADLPTSQTPQEPSGTPAAPRKGFPRGAIKAIAASGFLCGATTAFLALFAHRMGFPVFFVWLNIFTAVFMVAGSAWLLTQLKKAV